MSGLPASVADLGDGLATTGYLADDGLATALYLARTRPGLNVRAVGESPAAADAMGINVAAYRYLHVLAEALDPRRPFVRVGAEPASPAHGRPRDTGTPALGATGSRADR